MEVVNNEGGTMSINASEIVILDKVEFKTVDILTSHFLNALKAYALKRVLLVHRLNTSISTSRIRPTRR